jgi:hypothetical protein
MPAKPRKQRPWTAREGGDLPAALTHQQLEQIIKEERWGEPDGPTLEIELPILPSGRVVVTGKDAWKQHVPVPALFRALRINSLVPQQGEKYRVIIFWSGGARWRVVQKASRARVLRAS